MGTKSTIKTPRLTNRPYHNFDVLILTFFIFVFSGSEPSLLSGGSESEASKKVVSSQKDISCTKIPSYLRISCAVSGYGQYSGYKSIEKRSPFSSSSSLRSEPMSPDMPVTKVISPSHQRTSTSNSLGLCKLNNVVNGDITNGDCSLVINGHSKSSEDRYPTGDKKVVSSVMSK